MPRSYRGNRLRRRNPLDGKVPGVLIRPDRDREPSKPAAYEWSTWAGAARQHYRLTTGVGVAACGRSPGALVALSRRRLLGGKLPKCTNCLRVQLAHGMVPGD